MSAEPLPLPPSLAPAVPECFLESFPEPGRAAHRVPLATLPFLIGRAAAAQLVLRFPQVSKEHAEIHRYSEQFCIRDLNSTNGTFVNGQRVREAFLVDGDIVHIAHQEFRFVHGGAGTPEYLEPPLTELTKSGLPVSLIQGGERLRDLLEQHCVRITFQPIVELGSLKALGFEALGRGTHSDLSFHPSHLFKLAERCGLALELSQLFRAAAVKEAAALPENCLLFLNSHPREWEAHSLLPALEEIRARLTGNRRIVLEIHEDTTAEAVAICQFRDALRARGILLAYDDFGTGQARLAELAAAPPDFVKLDMRLVRGIHRDHARQNLVQAINRMIQELGIEVIAEGIETPEEAAMCLRLGCQYGQGFLFGTPQTAAAYQQTTPRKTDTHLVELSELRQRLGFQRG